MEAIKPIYVNLSDPLQREAFEKRYEERIAHARICLDYSDAENTCYCPVKYQTLEERKAVLGYEPKK